MEFHPDWLYPKEVEGQLLTEASPLPPCRDITPKPEVLLSRLHDRFYTLLAMKPSEKAARIKALKELLDVIDRSVESGHLRKSDVSYLRDQVKTFWETNIHWLKRERNTRWIVRGAWIAVAITLAPKVIALCMAIYDHFK